MTLIVGIKSKEGVVMASDGAATLGSMGQSTAQQPTKKLHALKNKIVMGVSGPVGLGQRLKARAETLYEGKLGKRSPEAMAAIGEELRKDLLPELKVAQDTRNLLGQVAINDAVSSTLMAVPFGGSICLFQFGPQGASEEATEDLPFASIGSGQGIADPFLALLRRVLWADHQPTMDEAIFAAVWTLDHAIKVNPGGVAEPMQVITITKPKDEIVLKELTSEELTDHREAVKQAEKAITASLSAFKKTVAGEGEASDVPPPPAVQG